jgi:pimeloyl-ACP methyl ester carboxylesterase
MSCYYHKIYPREISKMPALSFKSINPGASRTILLLHGAFSSGLEWELVCLTPHLSSYHLLIPDLPSHGQSTSASIPFNFPDTAALLADLVTKHAINGKADIVGMSLGGYTATYLAQKYPDIVGAGGLFISGCGRSWPAPGSWMTWASGLVLFFTGWVSTHVPKSIWDWICRMAELEVTDALYADMKASSSYKLGQTVAEALSEDLDSEQNWPAMCAKVRARTCIIAGLLDDGEKDCAEKGRYLRQGNSESMAFKVEGKRHAWDLQDPDLFARGISSWMSREELPHEYIALD